MQRSTPSVARLLRAFQASGRRRAGRRGVVQEAATTLNHLDTKGGIHVREDVAPSSFAQGTGSFEATPGGYLADEESTPFMARVGQAAMIVSGAALVALAAKQRS